MSDLIERQAAIEHFKRIIESTNTHGEEYNEGFNAGLEFCISHISTMPPAEQPTGHWIDRQRIYSELTIGTCSKCGLRVAVGKYCPHCGARMEGDES